MKSNFADNVDYILTNITDCQLKKGWPAFHRVDIQNFNNSIVVDLDFNIAENDYIFTDADLVLNNNFFDVKIMNKKRVVNGDPTILPFSFHRIRKVSPKNYRGKTQIYSRNLFKYDLAGINETKEFTNVTRFISYNKTTDKLVNVTTDNGDQTHLDLDDNDNMIFLLAHGLLFSQRYEWQVRINYKNQFNLLLFVKRSLIKELFKLRDLPEGKKRRPMLKNWISDHKRLKKDLSFTDVKKHLRGNLNFSWFDYNIEIIPSQFDIEENQR